MKKRIIAFILGATMLLALTGCMTEVATITVNEDGSGSMTVRMGFTAETVNQLIGAGMDAGTLQQFTYKGTTYHGEVEEETFEDLDEFNQLMDGMFHIESHGNSFALTLPNMMGFLDEQMEEYTVYGDITIDDIVMDATFNFPYPITQTYGYTEGVTFTSAYEVTFDIIELTRTPGIRIFHVGDFGQFLDVTSTAWYSDAVNYAAAMGLVSGYPGGNFGPSDSLSVAALCQIIYNLADVRSSSDSTYWAYNAIAYCIENGYIEYRGDITSANYDVPATREVAVAALNRYMYGVDEYYSLTAMYSIPDYLDVSDTYKNDIRGAYLNGIVSGVDSAGTFCPLNSITRAEFCQVYFNYQQQAHYVTEVN